MSEIAKIDRSDYELQCVLSWISSCEGLWRERAKDAMVCGGKAVNPASPPFSLTSHWTHWLIVYSCFFFNNVVKIDFYDPRPQWENWFIEVLCKSPLRKKNGLRLASLTYFSATETTCKMKSLEWRGCDCLPPAGRTADGEGQRDGWSSYGPCHSKSGR